MGGAPPFSIMRKKDAELQALRIELLKRQRAAGDKISKNRRQRGVEIAGTEFDPRVSRETVSRMTKASLQKRLDIVNKFVHRSNQFVAGAQGAPLPRAQYNEAKRLVERAQAKRDDWHKATGNLILPGGRETVGQRRAKMGGKHRKGGGMANAPEMLPTNFDDMKFVSAKGLKTFMSNIKRANQTGHKLGSVNKWREQFAQMTDVIGGQRGEALRAKALSLTDKQFALLWHDTAFSTAVSIEYEMALQSLKVGKDGQQISAVKSQILDESAKKADELVKWAKTQKLGR